MLDFSRFAVLTFDCYGTLIDWDTGIRRALAPILAAHRVEVADDTLLGIYADVEFRAESGDYCNYKTVLKTALRGIGDQLNYTPTETELDHFSNSIKEWPPFPDTVAALQALQKRYQLAIISNTDDDLFSSTQLLLQTEFDVVITAEQVKSYKPSLNNFERALERIGRPKEKILHVAQSVFHDIIPANRLSLTTAWVNRRKETNRWLAEEPQYAQPNVEVPDLQSLVCAAGL
jgi:2-haloacid dehalogenase